MKFLELKLFDDFRSLKSGFKLRFQDESPRFDDGITTFDDGASFDSNVFNAYCVVGHNGSGKSNILELLSSIFYQLEINNLKFLPQISYEDDENELAFKEHEAFVNYDVSPNAYELSYEIKGHSIKIVKELTEVPILYLLENDEWVRQSAVDMKEYLPEYIIGYSSGENEILSLPFLKMRMIQYDEYLDYVSKDISYPSAESRMVYLDDIYSQAIFVTNFLDVDNRLQQEGMLDIFRETLGISAIREFRMIINTQKDTPVYKDYEGSYQKEYTKLSVGVEKKIEILKSCSTLYYEDTEHDKLYLDFYLDDACREAFRRHFDSGRELFEFFQLLITLNYYHIDEKIKEKLYRSRSLYAQGFLPQVTWDEKFFTFKDFWIEKEGVDKPILSRSLSDGEYQFMHTIGIGLLYRGTSSLFLLDEPETHFNPSWRAKYISTLRKCFEGDDVSPEVLITSHSPFIVSDSTPENVLVFEKDEKGVVECTRPNFNTFGASVNKITMGIFEKRETIGEYAGQIIDEFKARMETTDDLEALFSELDETLGDSIEKTLFMKELFDRIEKK